MDVKSAFLYGKIEEEVYTCQPPGFEDPDFLDKVYKVEKALYGLPQAPRAWYETLSTYLLENRFYVNPKVSYLYALKRIFRYLKGQPKLGLWYPKDSPFDLVAYIDSDYTGASRKSTTGGCQFLGCRLISWQCKKQTVVANSITKAKYVAASSYYSQVLWIQNQLLDYSKSGSYINDSPFDLVAYIDSDYAGASLDRKSTTGGIGVNAGDSKLMLLGINLLLLEKVNAARHNLQLLVNVNAVEALVDGKKIVVTEAFIRRDLQLEDAEGVDCLPNATIFEQLTLMGAKTTAWNEFSSTMASAIICLANNQKFNFSKYIFESMVKNLDSAGKFLMYLRFVQVFLDNQLEGMINHNKNYIAPSHIKKVFANMKRQGKDFSGRVTPLFSTMIVKDQQEQGEGSNMLTIIPPSTSYQRKLRPRKPKIKDTKIPQSSVPVENVADKAVYEEMDKSLERATTTATSLDAEQDRGNISKTQSKATPNEPSSIGTSLGGSPRRQDTIGDTIAQTRSENVSKFSNDPLLAGVNIPQSGEDCLQLKELVEFLYDLDGDEVFVETNDLSDVDMTLAQALAELKSAKPKAVTTATATTTTVVTRPKAKGFVIQEHEQVSTPITSLKDKGKGLMVEEPLKMKKKDQEQEELTIEEKSKLFQQLLEKRRKHFAGWKPKDLKTKSFANVQELFDKAMKRVNTFVNMDTELVGGSEVKDKEGSETREESSSKRTEFIPDEEDVAVDAIPLATKPTSIGRIVGIKSLLEVTAVKLVLMVQKLLLLVLKVNAAGIKVTTAERLQLQRKDKDCSEKR
ncbi:putative ribonuclease H-like domain-containing protein [Tanacetum coccineum]